MSPQNVEVVRRVYAHWANGRMRAGVDLFHPQIVFQTFMPDSGERIVVHGPDEIWTFMRDFLSQWDDYRLFGDDFRQVGADRVLVLGRQSARGKHSGVVVEDSMSSVWTFEERKVVRLAFERDRQLALEAAGLSE